MPRRSAFGRPAFLASVVMTAFLCAHPMPAHGGTPGTALPPDLKSDEWKPILERHHVNPCSDDVAILIFDHTSSTWSVYHYLHKKAVGMDIERQPEPLGPDGNPLVLRSGAEKLLILVTNTSPFLYAYEGVVLPPQDSPDSAALRTLASALGSAASGLVKAVPAVKGAAPPSPLEKALDVIKDLSHSLLAADQLRQSVRAFTQAFEFNPSAKPPNGLNPYGIREREAGVLDGFARARVARADLDPAGQPPACFQSWTGLLSLLDGKVLTDDNLKGAGAELLKSSSTAPAACRATLNRGRDEIAALIGVKDKAREDKAEALRKDMGVATIRALLALDQALAGEKDAVASLGSANAFARIARDYLRETGAGNNAQYEVLPRSSIAVLSPPFPSQTWLKDNPGTLSIKAEGAVCADCVRLRPMVADKKFLLASRRQNVLGIGFGVVYTTITDPTFGAVHANKDTQVIGRTSEDSRSGAIVILGSLRLISAFAPNSKPRWAEFCLDLGAGLDVKKPSLFLGVSVEILRYARIGFGQTWQVVTRLDDGLQEAQYGSDGLPIPGTGTTLLSTGDIRTRNTVTSRPYVSLTFAVDALPFFQPK